MKRENQVLSRSLVVVLLVAILDLFGSSRTAGQTASQMTKPAASAESQASIQTLELGKPIERELAAGQTHSYQITLQKDQYLHVVVEQESITVICTLFGAKREKLVEINSLSQIQAPRSIHWIADVGGNYRLELRSDDRRAKAGRYKVRLEELRQVTDQDPRRVVAQQELIESSQLNEEVERLYRAGKYDDAISAATRALTIREKVLGPDHPDLAELLNNLAALFDEKGDYGRAEALYQQALAINEKALGPDHPDVANVLDNLALLYHTKGEYGRAEPLYLRALAIREKTLGPNDPDVATTLNNLAGLYENKGDYAKAEALNQRALTIREKALGSNHPDVAFSLNNLAILYAARGDYNGAEALYQRALAIRQKILRPDHPYIAFSLNGLGSLYESKGDYSRAEQFYQQVLAIREKALGPGHPAVAVSLNNLAGLYYARGDYGKAETLFQRALAINERALGSNHPSFGNSLNNLAVLYIAKGDYSKAEQLFQQALVVREKALGPDHASVAQSLNNLAALHEARGDYTTAESLYQRALVISEKALGSDHTDVASLQNNLARLYSTLGDYNKAESLYLRALGVREKVLGSDHPDVAESLNNLASLSRALNNVDNAIAYQRRGNEVRERILNQNLILGSERQKLLYLSMSGKETDRTLSLHIQTAPHNLLASQMALTILLRRKGRVLDAINDSLGQVRRNLKPQDQALLNELIGSRVRLATDTINGPGKLRVEEHRSNLRQLDERVDQLEGELSARSAEFRTQSQLITLEAVQKAIPAGAVLVEFASYHPYDARSGKYASSRYVAYTLAARGEPHWVELGAAGPIEKVVGSLRAALRDPKRRDVKQLSRALDAKVMQPVRKLIGQNKWLLISADGALNLIPFAALVDENSQYLVKKYLFTYLTSGRDLLRLQVQIADKQAPLVVANPDFGGKGPGREDPKLKPIQMTGTSPEATPASLFSKFYFRPLPGTASEGEALRGILPNVTLLTKREATKKAVEQVDGPKILHIATHGFFLENFETGLSDTRALQLLTADPARVLLQKGAGGIAGLQVENPLLRSGLALAGANEHKSDDNGILTAVEVAGLSLWGTKLVVLSACDTGVGEVKNGDGVYGLRRALVLAGSESQVMSLWPVNDAATRDLMIEYYKAIQVGQGRSEALRHVQLKMLNDPKHNHPAYWASFIQSGAWGPLQ